MLTQKPNTGQFRRIITRESTPPDIKSITVSCTHFSHHYRNFLLTNQCKRKKIWYWSIIPNQNISVLWVIIFLSSSDSDWQPPCLALSASRWAGNVATEWITLAEPVKVFWINGSRSEPPSQPDTVLKGTVNRLCGCKGYTHVSSSYMLFAIWQQLLRHHGHTL